MAERRRLPIIGNSPQPSPGGDEEPPAWHWVPIGALIAIAVGAVLARSFYVPYMQRQIERIYGRVSTRAEYERIDATLSSATRDALQLRLAVAGLIVAMLAVLVGGFAVGRFGPRTNQRHGTLAGITAMTLLVLFIGRGTGVAAFLGYLLLVPFGGLAGYLGALLGVRLRHRAQTSR